MQNKAKIKLKKALTVANVQNQTIDRVEFTGEWFAAFKKPQNRGLWFVWGGSGSGKSTFLMQLCKEFAKNYKTLYNLLEEEIDDSDYIERTQLCNMNEVNKKFYTASYNLEELDFYCSKRNSAKVIFIDSITYLTKDFEVVKALVKKYKNKIFVCSGHAEGKSPRTEFEKSVRFHAKVKVFVDGYMANNQGRTIGPNGGQYIIWKEGYEKLNGAA